MMVTVSSSAGLVDYREGSSDEDSDEEYIVPQKRIKVDRTAKRKGMF